MARALAELVDREDPALPLLQGWVDEAAGNGAFLRPPDQTLRADILVGLQVTTRSMLGAVAYETGGVTASDGLIRLLGSGGDRSLQQAAESAGCPLDGRYPDVLVVADDVLGGVFALNGGRFGTTGRGEVFHLAADDTVWVSLGVGYTDFVAWCLTGDPTRLYGPLADLHEYAATPRPAFDQAYAFYPFLWTREAKDSRPTVRTVSADESLKHRLDLLGFAVEPPEAR